MGVALLQRQHRSDEHFSQKCLRQRDNLGDLSCESELTFWSMFVIRQNLGQFTGMLPILQYCRLFESTAYAAQTPRFYAEGCGRHVLWPMDPRSQAHLSTTNAGSATRDHPGLVGGL